jgi:amidohydrolase
VLAAGDEFTIRLTGRGGHAAEPHIARDPIVAGAQIVGALQALVARRVDAQQSLVLSITKFQSGSTHNVIPDTAVLGGTCRCFDEALHARIVEDTDRICRAIAGSMDIGLEIERAPGYPVLMNDAGQADFAETVMRDLLGDGAVIRGHPPSMASEDFSFFANEVPGAYAVIGNGDTAPLHHPEYDFNDEAAPVGVAYWTRLVEMALPA